MSAIQGVTIETTDEGPFVDDVFWILRDKDGAILKVNNAAEGIHGMMTALGKLPGYDQGAVIEAQVCVENRIFKVY